MSKTINDDFREGFIAGLDYAVEGGYPKSKRDVAIKLYDQLHDLLETGKTHSDMPHFWHETSCVAIARKLRLAVAQNLFDGGLISEQGAKEILAGPLTPGDSTTIYDDSHWLNIVKREILIDELKRRIDDDTK